MHLRENHILAEIIDENGNPLPDGQWGELVITTIGQEAMPLIRYRTGDYTRILPPCPCGGVTRRLDMEVMDSHLFRISGLVDYRACFDGMLTLECACLDAHIENQLHETVRELFSELEVSTTFIPASLESRPMYLGKRYVQA